MSSDMAVSISTMAAFILDKIIPPVISRGVEIYFGPYVVEVVQACSGMNSMFSLFALSVIYMRYEESRKIWQMIILIALVVPVAIITNLLRVIILIMITHFSGEAMSQGIFHDITGIFSFVIALVFLGSVDHLLVKISNK
jgi:exosortase